MATSDKKVFNVEVLKQIATIVSDITGVEFTSKHDAMIQSRVSRRMSKIGIETLELYLEYLNNHMAAETQALVSLLTTHHTRFFREFSHFEYLRDVALPTIITALKKESKKKIRIWSAACSTGHEVYSLAMFLKKHLKEIDPTFDFEIYGTDVDPLSIKIANNGVYRWNELKEAPAAYLAQNWARGEGDIEEFVKAKTELKRHCRFEVGNLIELKKENLSEPFHVVFCRNVFIYFKQEQVTQITNEIMKRLHPEGFFVIGTSESLDKEKCLVNYEAPAVYRHRAIPSSVADTKSVAKIAKASPVSRLLRVLCVDDSSTILTLLKKILSQEAGFEVVATAKNGEEAASILESTKVDVVTLDLHMPVLGGLEYLKKYYKEGHPPVVVVSSVSRENRELAIESLECGARDYVEKPSMSDLKERGDEIKNKLRVAVSDAKQSYTNFAELERSFQSTNAISAKQIAQAKVYIIGKANQASGLNDQIDEIRRAGIEISQLLPQKASLEKLNQDLGRQSGRAVIYVAQETDDVCSELIAKAKSAKTLVVMNDFSWRSDTIATRLLRKHASFRVSAPSLAFHAIEFLRKAA